MAYVLRQPGKAKFFNVERYGSIQKRWMGVASQFIANIPIAHRRGASIGGYRPLLEPFLSWGASGEVWQRTGNGGLPTLQLAIDLHRLLSKYNPDEKFRIVHVEVTLAVRELDTAAMNLTATFEPA